MNEKEKFGCRKNTQRISFTKDFKRKALIELSKGRKPEEILTEATSAVLEINTTDKKYFAKLMHKWRKELYTNNHLLAFTSISPTRQNLENEIENIGRDDELDDVEIEFKKKMEQRKAIIESHMQANEDNG